MTFPAGEGELATLIRAFDWGTTTLGPIGDWPQSLRTATSLLVASPVPIVMLWGTDGVMIYNDAYSVFAGSRHPELLGSNVRDGWDEVADFNDNVMKVGLAGGTLSYKQQELTLYRDGRADTAWLDLDYSPVHDESGRPAGVVAIVIERTEEYLATRALHALNVDLEREVDKRSQERDRLWLLSQDMLGRATYDGNMAAVNPAWTEVLGWTERELLTNRYADIMHPDDVDQTLAAIARMGETGLPTRFENRIQHVDGSWKPIGWTVSPEPGGSNFIAIGRDLSDDKARETALRDAQEALRQSQKMEAVGQLTGGLAHDFNNLLTGIGGSLEMMQTRIAQGRADAVDRYAAAAQGAVKRAAALTHRLLAFSRRQTLDPRPTNVNRLVGDIEELVRRTVGPAVQVEVVGTHGIWPTLVDPNQLENALLNLCINARDAMPTGGRLTIETANRWLDERAAREQDLSPGQYVSLCVTDTGTGMTADVASKAFDPFFTTKPLGEGTGLGLSMIYGFARQSGGQVRIYSEVGVGTTMCIYLPRHDVDLPTEEAAAIRRTPGFTGEGEVVLVIDDEPTIRMLVGEVLSDAGYAAIEAADGPTGLKLLQSDARIDLLITDVGLPGGLNGRQVADAARVARPDLKVLFMTGYAENAVFGNGHLERGMSLLTKPFEMDALSRKIREVMSEK